MSVASTANHARFLPGQRAGHYESFFQRANHPTRPLAFWIRYTIFSPEEAPHAAVGELWAIVFDGETRAHVAVKREVPLFQGRGARFARDRFAVRVDDAELGPGALRGEAASRGHSIAWDLRYHGDEAPVLLLPEALYAAPLPRAKMLVGVPMATYDGSLAVDGKVIDVRSWVGSQNHNWGTQHTDEYAWAQVCGFDDEAAFLEVGTGRIKVGGRWTPRITQAALRLRGKEHRASGLAAVRAHGGFAMTGCASQAHGDPRGLPRTGAFDRFRYRFRFVAAEARVEGAIEAAREDVVGLAYTNPPGGVKQCLNTKIASAELTVTHTAGADRGRVDRLVATRRAAFEILTDDADHGVTLLA